MREEVEWIFGVVGLDVVPVVEDEDFKEIKEVSECFSRKGTIESAKIISNIRREFNGELPMKDGQRGAAMLVMKQAYNLRVIEME